MEPPITLKCDKCGHLEYYECEEHLFQDGKMWGLEDDSIICNKCLEDNGNT